MDTQQAYAFVLPDLLECGGAVVVGAMAMGFPIIATGWGGPNDYLDQSCPIRVKPDSRESLLAGFAARWQHFLPVPCPARELG
jgi:glycosyltransferase involved in cell wall biosynthesis